MKTRVLSLLSVATVFALAGATFGQQGQPGGGGAGAPGGGGRQPGGPGGAGGQGGGNLVERLMQSDANGDGQLQWDEVPEQMRERIFERNDTNKDKVLDKAELDAMRQRGGRGGQGGGPGAGGEGLSMHDAMEQAGRSMRALKRSEFAAATRSQDLRAVQSLQSALIAAKGDVASAKMSDAAKAKYKDDTATFQRDFRKSMIKGAILALELEAAINDGDAAASAKARDALVAHQDAAHDLFQPAEEERPAGGGGGGGQGGGQGGGGRPPR